MVNTPAMGPDTTSAPLPALPELVEDGEVPVVVDETFVQPDVALDGGVVILADRVKSAHCQSVYLNNYRKGLCLPGREGRHRHQKRSE